jgi:hypothetical protein
MELYTKFVGKNVSKKFSAETEFCEIDLAVIDGDDGHVAGRLVLAQVDAPLDTLDIGRQESGQLTNPLTHLICIYLHIHIIHIASLGPLQL